MAAVDKFTLSLRVPGMPSNVYRLKLFASSLDEDANSDEKLIVATWTPKEGITIETDVACEYMEDESPPMFMHAWLFVDQPVSGITTTSLIARGFVSYASTLTGAQMPMFLNAARVIATLNIRCEPGASRKPASSLSSDALRNHALGKQTAFREAVESHHSLLSRKFAMNTPPNAPFYYLDSNVTKVPITSFVYMSTIINNSASSVLRLLRSLLAGISPLKLTTEERLVDFCTLITRPLIYGDDKDLTPRGSSVIDLWVQLGTLPHIADASFDCEDGSGLVMSIVFLLRTVVMEESDAKLIELQECALRYTPFMTLGNLLCGGDFSHSYIPHAYVTMVDARWVDHQLSGTGDVPKDLHPALLLESTASFSGVLAAKRSTKLVDHHAALRAELRDVIDRRTMSLCRQYTPIHASYANTWSSQGNITDSDYKCEHRGSYQDIFVMMTADHRTRDQESRVLHFIATIDEQRIGVAAERLLVYDHNIRLHTVLSYARSDFKNLYNYIWQNQPKNNLPYVSREQVEVEAIATGQIVGYVDIPGRVWEQQSKSIIDSISSMQSYKLFASQHIDIADDMSIRRMSFELA